LAETAVPQCLARCRRLSASPEPESTAPCSSLRPGEFAPAGSSRAHAPRLATCLPSPPDPGLPSLVPAAQTELSARKCPAIRCHRQTGPRLRVCLRCTFSGCLTCERPAAVRLPVG